MLPDLSAASADPARLTRRSLLLEIAGLAVVIAVPAGAVVATTQPVGNPPGRETLMALSPAREALLAQRRAAALEQKRVAKKKGRKKKKPSRDHEAHERQREQGRDARRVRQRERAERREARQ